MNEYYNNLVGSLPLFTDAETPQQLKQKYGFVGMCEHIARCAGICYNTTKEKRGEDAVQFVINLAKKGHWRALEFGTVVLKGDDTDDVPIFPLISSFSNTPWAEFDWLNDEDAEFIVVTNLRYYLDKYVFVVDAEATLKHIRRCWESGIKDPLGFRYVDEESYNTFISWRPTIHYPLISRGVADEFRTHTMLSTLMRSTRYTGANEGKGGNTHFILPAGLKKNERAMEVYKDGCMAALNTYKQLLELGEAKQIARDVLPLGLGTEMVQSGFRLHWRNFVNLRTDSAAHPDAITMARAVEYLLFGDQEQRVTHPKNLTHHATQRRSATEPDTHMAEGAERKPQG